jgi:hypothetical protein
MKDAPTLTVCTTARAAAEAIQRLTARKQRATLHRAAAKDQGYEIDLGEYRPKKR